MLQHQKKHQLLQRSPAPAPVAKNLNSKTTSWARENVPPPVKPIANAFVEVQQTSGMLSNI